MESQQYILGGTSLRYDEVDSSIGSVYDDLAKKFGSTLNEKQLFHLQVATEEALKNALMHGTCNIDSNDSPEIQLRKRELYAGQRISMLLEWNTSMIRVTVEDTGRGFDPDAVADPTDEENVEKPNGRGMAMMYEFMDLVEYPEGDWSHGSRVVMEMELNNVDEPTSSPQPVA